MNVKILIGSLRKNSYNLRVGQVASRILRQEKAIESEIIIPNLPLFSQEYEESREIILPEAVLFREKMFAADAVIVCSPEYDLLPTAITLNACHWLSRGQRPLDETPTLLTGASSGKRGTRDSRDALRLAFEQIGADVLAADVFVGPAKEVFDSPEKKARLENELWEKINLLLKAV